MVADGGVGMAPRVDSPGLGMGLSLIASICDGFEIEQRDHGTRAHMRFAPAMPVAAMRGKSRVSVALSIFIRAGGSLSRRGRR